MLNVAILETGVGWHLKVHIVVMNGFQKQTGTGILHVDSRATVAPLQQSFSRVQIQPPFEFFRWMAVALKAGFRQERSNTLFKKVQVLGAKGGGTRFLGREDHPCALAHAHDKAQKKKGSG